MSFEAILETHLIKIIKYVWLLNLKVSYVHVCIIPFFGSSWDALVTENKLAILAILAKS